MKDAGPFICFLLAFCIVLGALLLQKKHKCKHRKHFYSVEHYWDVSYGGKSKSYMFAWKCLDCGHTECGHVYGGGWPTKEWLNRMEPHRRLADEAEARLVAKAAINRIKEKA